MRRFFFLGLMVSSFYAQAQFFILSPLTPLSAPVQESSGLLYLDGKVITHADSGTANELYELNETTGAVTRTVVVENASNVDWEDIAQNDTHIFIGDFGNNAGTRTDLKIYRIAINDYLTTPNDTVFADTLFFEYEDQTDFSPATYTTNFDCEAMIATSDSLYLFTKNWGNFRTNVYGFSNTPGVYIAPRLDSMNTEGMVCGADIDSITKKVMLIGYTIFESFAYQIEGYPYHKFSEGTQYRADLSNPNSIQIEGVAFKDYCWFVSSETHSSGDAYLNELCVNDFGIDNVEEKTIAFYPNPSNTEIQFKKPIVSARIYNLNGQEVYFFEQNKIDVSKMQPGIYWIQSTDLNGKVRLDKLIVN